MSKRARPSVKQEVIESLTEPAVDLAVRKMRVDGTTFAEHRLSTDKLVVSELKKGGSTYKVTAIVSRALRFTITEETAHGETRVIQPTTADWLTAEDKDVSADKVFHLIADKAREVVSLCDWPRKRLRVRKRSPRRRRADTRVPASTPERAEVVSCLRSHSTSLALQRHGDEHTRDAAKTTDEYLYVVSG
jgi:hypothetical protein